MQIDALDWFKVNYLTRLYLLILSTRFILIVDTNKEVISIPDRQMCTKIQSMLSYGKYQTSQMSSNITYVSRVYAQNFLAYSPLDNILIFIEPKHQLHVYNAQTIRLIVNITTTNVVYATSCTSLTTDDRHDLFFVYESRIKSNLVSIRVCEIRFDAFKFNFEEKKCINTLKIRCDTPDIRINGFTIKRDHADTKKSLLFVSTNIGLVYTIFDTQTGSLVREPIVLNDTLNEGSVVVTSSGVIYYANKQEHTIHEIHITRDFRIRYGKIIKSNAIKSPFGLITDECNHLYIATKSMILVMFIEKYTTIRSVFLKASDLPISIERLNSTTYVYATVKKYPGTVSAIWMFNFLSFADPEKLVITTRSPVGNKKKKLDVNDDQTSSTLESSSLLTTDTTKTYTLSSSIPILHTHSPEHSTSVSSNEVQNNLSDENLGFATNSLHNEINLTQPSSSDSTLSAEHIIHSTNPTETVVSNDNSQSSSSSTILSKYVTSTINSLNTLPSDASSVEVSNDYTSFTVKTTVSTDAPNSYSQLSTSTTQETDEEKSTSSVPLSTDDSTVYLHSSTATSASLEVTSSSQTPSTILIENTTPFSIINNEHTTVQSLSTDIASTPLATTLRTTSEDHSGSTISHLSTSNIVLLSISQINDVITSVIPLETTSLQTQSHLTSIESSSNNVSDDLNSEAPMTTNSSIYTIQASTPFTIVTDFIDKEMEDGMSEKHSSPMLAEVDVSSIAHSSSPFILSSTTLLPSHSSQFSSPLSHSSLAHSSTTSTTILNRLLSSKSFSVTTTMSTPPTTFSSSISTLQTTDSATTSDTTEQSSIITFSDEPSSPLITSYPDDTSSVRYETSSESTTTDYATLLTTIVSSAVLDFTTTMQPDESSTSLLRTTDVDENLATTHSPTLLTTIVSSTILDSTTTIQPDESSTSLLQTTDVEENLATTDSTLFETITASSITDEYSSVYTSTQSSLEITSTIFSDIYTSKAEQSTLVVTHPKPLSNRPTRRKTSESTTSSTTTSTTTTITITTTPVSYRIRKQKVTRLESLPATTTITTSTAFVQITSLYNQVFTPSPTPFWHSKLNSLQQQQIIVIKPSFSTNSSNILLSNELLKTLFNNATNSSNEKVIFINLADLPPSSWNVSLHTNASILLDIVLPPASHPSNLNTTTNLTINNVEANRFATTIVGVPINLQVDQIQTKQFSLAMNLTNEPANQSLSDVVIGHIKSEQFELNITKSDNMNLHVQQVDSDTAELFFDSRFCTNESNLQINLNLSKNGTIRYGNQTPLRIGPVFTRVHMLKQSCDLDQPFTLFFDICQGQNPCLNGATCQSKVPDYDSPSYSQQESSQINYQCICPIDISGEHCQYSQYPYGYCINNGSLISTFDDINNQSIKTCLCAPGFQGQHCQENIDDCINIHCSNHGICQDEISSYSCLCFNGFYGSECEQKNVETVLLQVVSKSFATVAILLIAAIAGLFVASDIHTYLTREKQKPPQRLNRLPRVTSELFENSVLLLGFGDAPIEMSDLSAADRSRASTAKQRAKKMRTKATYHRLEERRYTKTSEKPPSKRPLLSNRSYETIL